MLKCKAVKLAVGLTSVFNWPPCTKDMEFTFLYTDDSAKTTVRDTLVTFSYAHELQSAAYILHLFNYNQ
jgi:hypothetical protein